MKSNLPALLWINILTSGYLIAQTTQTFTSTGTFVPAAGVISISVAAWGGGGGGGSAISATTAAGGGGGGAFAQNTSISVTAGNSYAVIVGLGGQGGTSGANGDNGVASTFDASQVVAVGGVGGAGTTTTTPGTGGSGGSSASSTGASAKFSGGNGAAGVSASGGGGGGGSAGSTSVGGNGGTITAGTAGTGAAGFTGAAGGTGGNGTTGSDGTAGTFPAGGGGGGRRGSDNTDRVGGAGANGQVKITYTCPTYSLTGTTGTAYSTGNGATITLAGAAANLPTGKYTVTYNLSGANTATGLTASMTVSSAGSGTFVTSSLANTGSTTVTVTNLSSGSPTACSSAIAANNTVSVSSNDVIGLSGGNWTNTTNWSVDGSSSCSCTPGSTNQVVASVGTIILNTSPITIGALAGSGSIRASTATSFTIGALNTNTTFSGTIVNNTQNINITKTGTGTLTLSGSNTYVGTNAVSNGTLSLANSTALGSAANTATISSGATLDINGVNVANNITLSGNGINSVGALTGTGTATFSGTVTTTGNFSIGGTGTLTVSGVISGSNKLEKVGTGTLILSGANTYSGGTKISAGTLTLGAAGVLADAGAVDFADGTFSSGSTTGFNETMGTISISSTSTLALATGVHSLNFSGKGSFSTDKVLTITGWTGGYDGTSGTSGKVFIGTSASLSSTDLAQIWFYDGTRTYPAKQLATGEVVPVATACPNVPPTPSTPSCGSLTLLSSATLSNNTDYGVSGTGSCSNTSVTLSSNLQGGNASTNIYIKAGETLTINGSINSTFVGNIYVLAGGVLNLSGDINGGNIYVYGLFNHALTGVARNQGSPSKVYVAYGGVYNAGSEGGSYQQNNTGTLIVEGAVYTSNLDQFQNNALACMNNSGCFSFSAVNTVNVTQSPSAGFQSGTSGGSLYYLPNSCPSTNANFSNSTYLNICAPNIPTSSVPCSRFGSAKVFYGAACNPSTSGCTGVVALPITLLYFKASVTNEGVFISWATTDQWDSDYFIIEKSRNGEEWEYVGTMTSTNGMGTRQNYGLLDETPYQGGSYYRLVEVNKDGKRTPYAVDYVKVDSAVFELFAVYPNPTTGDLNVKIVGEDVGYDFVCVDVLGKIIFSKKLFVGVNSLGPILSVPGVYFARLKVHAEDKVVKVVKQ